MPRSTIRANLININATIHDYTHVEEVKAVSILFKKKRIEKIKENQARKLLRSYSSSFHNLPTRVNSEV